jgi:chromatin assembly factor 1 subunit B
MIWHGLLVETTLLQLPLIILHVFGVYKKVRRINHDSILTSTDMMNVEMCLHVFADHTHYVQGVTWDPLGQFIATQSSDRSVAIYKYRVGANGKIQFSPCSRRFNKLDKGKVGNSIQQDESASSTGAFRLYHDENLVSFFRRLCFSPDGALLVTPAGLNKTNEGSTSDQDDSSEDCQNCAYIYPRNTLVK